MPFRAGFPAHNPLHLRGDLTRRRRGLRTALCMQPLRLRRFSDHTCQDLRRRSRLRDFCTVAALGSWKIRESRATVRFWGRDQSRRYSAPVRSRLASTARLAALRNCAHATGIPLLGSRPTVRVPPRAPSLPVRVFAEVRRTGPWCKTPSRSASTRKQPCGPGPSARRSERGPPPCACSRAWLPWRARSLPRAHDSR
jgi:hypothetical protein